MHLPKIPRIILALIAAPALCGAANITWTYDLVPDGPPNDGTLDWAGHVNTTGTLISAQNLGGGTAGTYGGVAFTAGTFSFGNNFTGYYNGNAGNNLAHTGTWNAAAASLTLKQALIGQDLEIGRTYQVQLFIGDARTGDSVGRLVSLDGGTKVRYAFNSGAWEILAATGTFVADAISQTISINTFNPAGAQRGAQLNGFQIRVTSPPLTDYELWANANGLSLDNRGINDDPDGDGMTNLMEYVYGGSPVTYGKELEPLADLDDPNPTYYFYRSHRSVGQVALVCQWSTDLTTWTDIPIGTDSLPPVTITDLGNGADVVAVAIPQQSGKIFVRLKATK